MPIRFQYLMVQWNVLKNLLTAAGQKNRNHLEGYVQFEDVSFGMEEVLYDPQTSGGLLFAVPKAQAEELCEKLQRAGLPAAS